MGHLDQVRLQALPPAQIGTWQGLISSLAILVLLCAYLWKPRTQKYANAPISCLDGTTLALAKERFKTDAQGMLREGYERNKGRPFYVPSPLGERLMIPGRYVEELKTAPVNEVDFVATFYEVLVIRQQRTTT